MRPQLQSQVAVQLYHGQTSQPLDQGLRQRRQAWPNLYHGLPGLRRNGLHDVFDDAPVGQEMLAKAFARDVFHVTCVAKLVSKANNFPTGRP